MEQASPPDRLLSVGDLSGMLQVPVATIYQWRHRGEGPRPMRLGKYLRFDPADVASWIEARKACSGEGPGQ
jgi:predicted DNA-binding transcriptional regulator AlpA